MFTFLVLALGAILIVAGVPAKFVMGILAFVLIIVGAGVGSQFFIEYREATEHNRQRFLHEYAQAIHLRDQARQASDRA